MHLNDATRTLRQPRLGWPGLADAVIEAGLLISIIIAPLYFNPRTYQTFEPDKATLLRSIVLIALIAWLIKRLETTFPARDRANAGSELHRDAQKRTRRQQNPGATSPFALRVAAYIRSHLRAPLVFPTLLLVAAYFLGTAASVLPRVSVWGSYERRQGLYTFVGYVLLFFLSREILRTPDRRRRLLDAIILVSLPVSVYGLLQRFGLDPLVFQTAGAEVTARAISTLGNPIFLGGYLIMVIPLTVRRMYQVWRLETGPRAEVGLAGMYATLLILQLAALYTTQSRGPTLGLLAGLGFCAVVWAAALRARRLIAGLALLAIVGVVTISVLSALGTGTSALGRLGQLVNPASRTGRQRVLAWQGVVNLVSAEPVRTLIGYGPETLRDLLPRHMPAEIASLKPDEDFDRAHNAVLDLWATTGLIGVLAYLSLIVGLFYYGLCILGLVTTAYERRLFISTVLIGALLAGIIPWLAAGRHWTGVGLPLGLLAGVGAYVLWQGMTGERQSGRLSGDQLLTVVLLAAVVGHLVETLVGIATVATQTLFWVYAALIANLATAAPEPARIDTGADTSAERHFDSPPPLALGAVWGLITGIALALFGFALVNAGQIRGALAWGVIVSVTLVAGVWFLMGEKADAGGEVFRYLSVSTGTVVSLLLLTWLPWPPLDSTHPAVAVFAFSILALLVLGATLVGPERIDTVISPPSWRRWSLYSLLTVIGLTVIWLANINPIRADVFYKQGLGLSTAGSFQNAAHAFEASVALHPSEDRYQSGVGATYAQMAQTEDDPAVREELLSAAEVYLSMAHRLNPYRADHLRNLGLLYRIWADLGSRDEREARYTQALDFYRQAAARNPVGVRIQTELAGVYGQLGRWEAAAEHYRRSIDLNDTFVEAHLGLGDAYLHLGDYGEAASAYRNALAIDEKQALAARQQAAQKNPDDPIAHQSLALLYAGLGRTNVAMDEAARAQQLMAEVDPVTWDRFMMTLKQTK